MFIRTACQIARRLITQQLYLQHHFDPATLRTLGCPPSAIWEVTGTGRVELTHRSGVRVSSISTGKELCESCNIDFLTIHISSRASNEKEEEEIPDFISNNIKSNRRSYLQENQVWHINIVNQSSHKSEHNSR